MREGSGAVEDFEDGVLGEVEIVEAEVAQVVRGEGAQDGFAAALVEKDLVADEDVAGLECGGVFGGGFDFSNEAICGGEAYAGAGRITGRSGQAKQKARCQGSKSRLPPGILLPGFTQKLSRTSATRERAKSRERRSTAAGLSSRKVARSVVA
jgi:hypothetical protein